MIKTTDEKKLELYKNCNAMICSDCILSGDFCYESDEVSINKQYDSYVKNGYSLMKGNKVKDMEEKSMEDKIEELNESCSKLGSCSRCILKDDSCSDDEKTDDMYKKYVDNGCTLENKESEKTIDEIKDEFRLSCTNCSCGSCIFNKYTDCFGRGVSDEELKSRYKEYEDNEYSLYIGKKKNKEKKINSIIKNKHPFNSTQIISIKRKGRKLYMRYIEDGKVYKVSASCHRDDDFNIIDGLKVLTDKLSDKLTGNGNFKFVALDNDDDNLLTKGMIYNCVNGKIMFDHGHMSNYSYKDFDHFLMLNRDLNGYVLEVKGDAQ